MEEGDCAWVACYGDYAEDAPARVAACQQWEAAYCHQAAAAPRRAGLGPVVASSRTPIERPEVRL